MDERPKVLLIDDSEIVRDVTRAVLERDGFDVQAAASLGEFNRILRTWSPNIVLTDVQMPGVSGGELCVWIKSRIETEGVPVVFFSDLPEAKLEELARNAGADAFLSKSKGVDHLAAELKALVEAIVW
jgi:CheY-like chemotaxis protein